MLSTPPAGIHSMTYNELVMSRLATIWIFDSLSSFGGDPDGLMGDPVGAAPASAGMFALATQSPMLGAVDGHVATLAAEFVFRPGGGAIHASLNLTDAAAAAGFARPGFGSYIVANDKDDPVRMDESEFDFGATGWIPRDIFCRLRGSRRAFVEFAEPSFDRADDERRREHLARINFASTPNAAALFAEACSGPIAASKH